MTYCNVLIYGPPGFGKTTTAAKSPTPLILDFESGTMSVRDMDVMVATPRSLEEVVKVIKKAEAKGVETLIIDSVTEMQRHFMNEVMSEMVRKDPRKTLFSPTLEAWGMVTEMMRYVIRRARDAEMHTVFVALETLDNKEIPDKIFARPACSPKVGDDLAAYVDVIGRLTMVKKERVLSFVPSEQQIAKDRSGVLPATLSGKDLSIQTIIDLINDAIPDDDEIEEPIPSEGDGEGKTTSK